MTDDTKTKRVGHMPGPIWRFFHFVNGAWEIGRADNYTSGCICMCHNAKDAKMVVEALNDWEAKHAAAKAESPHP